MKSIARILLVAVLVLGVTEGCHKKGKGPYLGPTPARMP